MECFPARERSRGRDVDYKGHSVCRHYSNQHTRMMATIATQLQARADTHIFVTCSPTDQSCVLSPACNPDDLVSDDESSHSSMPDLEWHSSSDGDSSDSDDTSDGMPRSTSYVTKYANKHSLESECRHCMSRGSVSMLLVCRPCWPDLRPLRAAARRQHDLCVQILSNDYCPIVAGGTRTSVLYYGIRCYRQRRQADTGYDVLDYVKSLKRFKLKSSLNISYLGVEKYLRLAHVNIGDIHVQVD